MINLYGGTGMGTSGTGMNTGGGMSLPQLMAMMQAQGGGAAGPTATTPLAPGSGPTPMSNYIGATQPAGGMQHQPMAAVAGNPAPATAAQAGAPSQQNLMQMLSMLKAGQGGVAPQQGQLPASQNPNAQMSWLQQLLGSMGGGAGGAGIPAAAGTGAGAGGFT